MRKSVTKTVDYMPRIDKKYIGDSRRKTVGNINIISRKFRRSKLSAQIKA